MFSIRVCVCVCLCNQIISFVFTWVPSIFCSPSSCIPQRWPLYIQEQHSQPMLTTHIFGVLAYKELLAHYIQACVLCAWPCILWPNQKKQKKLWMKRKGIYAARCSECGRSRGFISWQKKKRITIPRSWKMYAFVVYEMHKHGVQKMPLESD